MIQIKTINKGDTMNQVEQVEIKKNDDLTQNEKVRALQNHLNLNDDEANNITFNGDEFLHDDREYLILTDDEAEEKDRVPPPPPSFVPPPPPRAHLAVMSVVPLLPLRVRLCLWVWVTSVA